MGDAPSPVEVSFHRLRIAVRRPQTGVRGCPGRVGAPTVSRMVLASRRDLDTREQAEGRLADLLRPPSGWVPPPPPPVPDPDEDFWGPAPRGRHRAGPGSNGRPARAVVGRAVPSTLREARWGVSWRAAAAAAVVVVALAGVVVLRSASATPGEPVPVRSTPAGASSPAPSSGVSSAGAPTTGSAVAPATSAASGGQDLLVHVVGQVASPGVVRVPAGSRVADVLESAGGALDSADLARVNLARVVVDGEQVLVPRPGEPAAPVPAGSAPGDPAAAGGSGGPGSPLPLNTADLAALDSLPGIGPVLAQRILDWRQEHGSFSTVEELGEVSGIGDRLLEQLRPLVTV